MNPDSIQITTYEELNQETAGSDGLNVAGYLVNNTHVVCGKCAKKEGKEDKNAIFEDSEADYMSLICEDCGKPLDTYVLVYQNQDPKLWHHLVWNQQLGIMTDLFFDDEKLAKCAENQAYEEGWQEGSSMENALSVADIENDPIKGEFMTDTAYYANTLAPELRAMSGYLDSSGKGTYTEVFRDISHFTFNDGVIPAFHAGYYDRIVTENEKWDSWDKWTIED